MVIHVRQMIYCAYYLILMYLLSFWYIFFQFIKPHKKAKLSNQEGRIALITGGGTGIGYETSRQLLKAGMTVIIAGIEKDQREGIKSLQKEYKNRVQFIACDLSSLKSVRQAADSFKALKLPLHLLINNAAIMFAPRTETEEGFESHWVVNYLGHFLLVHLLLDKLIQSATGSKPSRVVSVSSCLHYTGTVNYDDIQGKLLYSPEAAYAQSKLALVLFTRLLTQRLQNENIPVLVNCVHPAVVFSGLYKYVWFRALPTLMKATLKTPAMGSDSIVHAAVAASVKKGGDYYEDCEIRLPSKEAQSSVVAEKLWKLSCSQTKIKRFGNRF